MQRPPLTFGRKSIILLGLSIRSIKARLEKRIKSGCSAVGSACTLGYEAERRQWRMQQGGVRAAVEKDEYAKHEGFFGNRKGRRSRRCRVFESPHSDQEA